MEDSIGRHCSGGDVDRALAFSCTTGTPETSMGSSRAPATTGRLSRFHGSADSIQLSDGDEMGVEEAEAHTPRRGDGKGSTGFTPRGNRTRPISSTQRPSKSTVRGTGERQPPFDRGTPRTLFAAPRQVHWFLKLAPLSLSIFFAIQGPQTRSVTRARSSSPADRQESLVSRVCGRSAA
jgi:hypothetical protein